MMRIGVTGASQRGHGYHYAKRFNSGDGEGPPLRVGVSLSQGRTVELEEFR